MKTVWIHEDDSFFFALSYAYPDLDVLEFPWWKRLPCTLNRSFMKIKGDELEVLRVLKKYGFQPVPDPGIDENHMQRVER